MHKISRIALVFSLLFLAYPAAAKLPDYSPLAVLREVYPNIDPVILPYDSEYGCQFDIVWTRLTDIYDVSVSKQNAHTATFNSFCTYDPIPNQGFRRTYSLVQKFGGQARQHQEKCPKANPGSMLKVLYVQNQTFGLVTACSYISANGPNSFTSSTTLLASSPIGRRIELGLSNFSEAEAKSALESLTTYRRYYH